MAVGFIVAIKPATSFNEVHILGLLPKHFSSA
jgi:hypothetical protein